MNMKMLSGLVFISLCWCGLVGSRASRNCERLCATIPECMSNPKHQGSYCKDWQQPVVCFGIYHRDASRKKLCFAPNDSSCPQNFPVSCHRHHGDISERSTTFRSTYRSSSRTQATGATTTSSTRGSTTSTTTTTSTSTSTTTATTSVILLACSNPNFRVGAGGDFTTIQEALQSPAVTEGAVILVLDGTYLETSTIVVSKSVSICGESRTGTIFTTASTSSDPPSVFSVTANNVALVRMTIRQLNTAGTTVGTAVSASGTGFPQTRVGGFMLDDVLIEYTEIGVSIRGSDWTIQDSSISYVGPNCNRYGIIMYGVFGSTIVKNVMFINNASTERLRAVYLSSTSGSNPNEDNFGTLTLAYNGQSGTLQEFFVQDNFQGGFQSLSLRFLNNIFSEITTWAAAFAVTNFAGDIYSFIELTNNEASGAGGKGLFTIDGFDTSLAFRGIPLYVGPSGNIISSTALMAPFVEAPGSIGSLVAYNADLFSAPSCLIILL